MGKSLMEFYLRELLKTSVFRSLPLKNPKMKTGTGGAVLPPPMLTA
jgi:hypothetical protein